jgi:hypothetical protein
MKPNEIKHAQAMEAAINALKPQLQFDSQFDLREIIGNLKAERMQYVMDCISENGKVAVVESGRDCDCVQYSGHVHIIEATTAAYEELYDHTAEWADGPFFFELMRCSVAGGIQAESRDLAMEAYEDGHAHVVYSAFP